jgi:hypothetical protein
MAYLFTYFTETKGDQEYIWFAVSKDGLHWTDLGGEEPILSSRLGTNGIRDPFIVYDEKLKKYFIIATDLLTTSGNWYNFSHKGSRSLLVWESEDLITWSEERLIEVGIKGAGCVWAPEAIFCKEKDMWFVFWASCVREKGQLHHKQRIYGSFTKDFKEFSPAFKFIDAKTDVIDTNIVWDNGFYYRFSKDETNKVIKIEKATEILSENWEVVSCDAFDSLFGLEGPEVYYLNDLNKWCLIADQYHEQKGYAPFLCDDLALCNFKKLEDEKFDLGKRKKRHGGVIEISDEQMNMLIEKFGIYE